MFDLRTLLIPPEICQQQGSAIKDKRRGWVWHCRHARKNTGVGRAMPPCVCKRALEKASAALASEKGPADG